MIEGEVDDSFTLLVIHFTQLDNDQTKEEEK